MDANRTKTEACNLKKHLKLKAAIKLGTISDVRAIIEHGTAVNHLIEVSAQLIFCQRPLNILPSLILCVLNTFLNDFFMWAPTVIAISF